MDLTLEEVVTVREHKNFWDRNAGLYDRFMRKDGAAYEMIYERIQPVVQHKTVLELAGFPLRSKWASEEYLNFLRQNGWTVRKSAVLKASFPLTYAECVKMEV